MSIQITQNGQRIATSWEQVRFSIFNTMLKGATGVSYGSAQEKQNNYATGNEPHERGRGNKAYENSITVTANAARDLRRAVPTGDLVDIEPFDYTLIFQRAGAVAFEKIHFLGCEFTGQSRSITQGDMEVLEELPIISHKICFGDEALQLYQSGALLG